MSEAPPRTGSIAGSLVCRGIVPLWLVTGASAAAMGGPMAGVVTMVTSTLPPPRQAFDLDRPLREARDAFEKSYFEFHLAQEGGSMTRVADKTGLERTHLYRKLKQLGVDLSRGRRSG